MGDIVNSYLPSFYNFFIFYFLPVMGIFRFLLTWLWDFRLFFVYSNTGLTYLRSKPGSKAKTSCNYREINLSLSMSKSNVFLRIWDSKVFLHLIKIQWVFVVWRLCQNQWVYWPGSICFFPLLYMANVKVFQREFLLVFI